MSGNRKNTVASDAPNYQIPRLVSSSIPENVTAVANAVAFHRAASFLL